MCVTSLPQSRPLTRRDLEAVPDDGHRHELIDGCLLVTPSPSVLHQVVSSRLHGVLDTACPPHLIVFSAPCDVVLGDRTVLQPDLLVTDRAAAVVDEPVTAPVLVVEILSPSTRLVDLHTKRARYEAAGCPAYWVVDPSAPSVISWELRDVSYVETARVCLEETLVAHVPFEVTVKPAELLR
ncbi:MAG TPA: Uma2 family endonuclease [Marmoricola sp.]|nr:Uma2 family endonuclease [Marmoricola sp.]